MINLKYVGIGIVALIIIIGVAYFFTSSYDDNVVSINSFALEGDMKDKALALINNTIKDFL